MHRQPALTQAPSPSVAGRFRVERPAIDGHAGKISLSYTAPDGRSLVEEWAVGPFPRDRLPAVDRAARILAVCAMTSYYKAYYGAEVDLGPVAARPALVALAEALLGPGLAEFRYVNGLPVDHTPPIAARDVPPHEPSVVDDALVSGAGSRRRALVAMGGGKDSIVAARVAVEAGREIHACSVNAKPAMVDSADAIGVPLVRLSRLLDAELFELNRHGALNGHIPITAINSAGLVLAACAHGFDEVVFANESSANAPTFSTDGVPVNHQFSKSWEFEYLFRRCLEAEDIDVDYFSALRPLSEVLICRLFAGEDSKVRDRISSCNRNFGLQVIGAPTMWCGRCPKCAFVYLALAPFLGRRVLEEMFGRDLLDDLDLLELFEQLAATTGERPLECIGTPTEVRWLVARLAGFGEWDESRVLQRLVSSIPEPPPAFDPEAITGPHALPPDVERTIWRLL